MTGKTKIEWTDKSWNLIVGCSVVSPGCTNCYATRQGGGMLDGSPRDALVRGPHAAQEGRVRLVRHARPCSSGGCAMITLSIRQPCARAIVYEEFRDLTSCTAKPLFDAACNIPDDLERGSIVLANPHPLGFLPVRGKADFFDSNNADDHCREVTKIVKDDAAQPDLFGPNDA
jgi:hypothetical protein